MTARAAVLTASGRGAIAVVRVWGADALAAVDRAFRPSRNRPLRDTPHGRPRVGHIGAGTGDEVVVLLLGDDETPAEIEIQTHGGIAAVELVLAALGEQGVDRADPEAWLRRSSRSELQVEAEFDLAHAPTLRTAAILLDQAQGALDLELAGIVGSLSRVETAGRRLEELRQRSRIGRRLREGWRVALCGRPNVGKSSLMNALAGFERAIVSPAPGTTRDALEAHLAVDGWPISVYDLAGIRESTDPIEAAGVARACAEAARADLRLLLLDSSEPLDDLDRQLLADLPDALRIATKADLTPAWDGADHADLAVSAFTAEGLPALRAAIAARLVGQDLPAGAAVPFRARHVQAIDRALSALAAGRVEKARAYIEALITGPAA